MGKNEYEYRVQFLDEDGYLTGDRETYTVEAEDSDEASTLVDELAAEEADNIGADAWETELIDVH